MFEGIGPPPNPAFSEHGYAVGQRRRFGGGVASPAELLDGGAALLTQSLSRPLRYARARLDRAASGFRHPPVRLPRAERARLSTVGLLSVFLSD